MEILKNIAKAGVISMIAMGLTGMIILSCMGANLIPMGPPPHWLIAWEAFSGALILIGGIPHLLLSIWEY